MAPSRGIKPPSKHSGHHGHDTHDDAAIEQQGNSALISAKRNFNYLISPTSAADRPATFRTRALLRTFRYAGQFIFWRLVRWAKYAAVGALVAAVGATVFGSVVTGVAWIAAPPTIFSSVLAASVWGVGKFIARKLNRRWKVRGGDAGEAARERIEDSPIKQTGSYGQELGPQAVPW